MHYVSKYRDLVLVFSKHFNHYFAQLTDPNLQEPKINKKNYQFTLVTEQVASPLWQRWR